VSVEAKCKGGSRHAFTTVWQSESAANRTMTLTPVGAVHSRMSGAAHAVGFRKGTPPAPPCACLTYSRRPQGLTCGRQTRRPPTDGWPRLDASVVGSCRLATASMGGPRFAC
jgi:hypothetical protein